MPIYDYTCVVCRADFEYFARTLTDKAKTCPVCGAASPQKNLSVFAPKSVVFTPPAGCGGCPGSGSCSHGGGCGCH